MPSRYVFNPDQLQAHFDRIAEATGVRLVDDNRMIMFPSGHRYVVGRMRHRITPDPDSTPEEVFTHLGTTLSLHSEGGLAAHMSMSERQDNEGFYLHAVDTFLRGDDHLESHISWKPGDYESDGQIRRLPNSRRPGNTFFSVNNPTDEQTEELVNRNLQSKLLPDEFVNPGSIEVVEDEPTGDWRDSVEIQHGRYAYNSVRRRYERVPE